MLDHRLQILLDEERYQKVLVVARRKGVSVASVIREAIDRLPDDRDQRRAAIDAVLAAEPMSVPEDPADIRRELELARDIT